MSDSEGAAAIGGERSRMRRIAVAVIACALMSLPVSTHAAEGDPPCPDGQAPDPSGLVCVFLDHTTTGVEVATTEPAAQDPWLTQALELEHRLGDALPLRDAMWVGTHNSFNTVSNSPRSLSNTDGNQRLSMVDQLAVGIRSLEIDIHWMPSVWAGGSHAVVVCHGLEESQANAGCTYERLLADELEPIGEWLRDHPGDVVLLYVEDDFSTDEGFAQAATAINDTIGDLVYTPPAGAACPLLPLDLRRADVLAAGKQVVVMSGCSSGLPATGAWTSTVFDDFVRSEDGNPEFAEDAPCTTDAVLAEHYGTKLVRFYEDSTFVSTANAGGDPGARMNVKTIENLVRCGANLLGLDQVEPSDPRLAAMVWSWAPNEPVSNAAGTCAFSGADGRFHSQSCTGARLRYACVDSAGAWFVTRAPGLQSDGARACQRERRGSTFAVPGSGNHAQRLDDAKAAAGASEVWLAYAVLNGTWSGVAR